MDGGTVLVAVVLVVAHALHRAGQVIDQAVAGREALTMLPLLNGRALVALGQARYPQSLSVFVRHSCGSATPLHVLLRCMPLGDVDTRINNGMNGLAAKVVVMIYDGVAVDDVVVRVVHTAHMRGQRDATVPNWAPRFKPHFAAPRLGQMIAWSTQGVPMTSIGGSSVVVSAALELTVVGLVGASAVVCVLDSGVVLGVLALHWGGLHIWGHCSAKTGTAQCAGLIAALHCSTSWPIIQGRGMLLAPVLIPCVPVIVVVVAFGAQSSHSAGHRFKTATPATEVPFEQSSTANGVQNAGSNTPEQFAKRCAGWSVLAGAAVVVWDAFAGHMRPHSSGQTWSTLIVEELSMRSPPQ